MYQNYRLQQIVDETVSKVFSAAQKESNLASSTFHMNTKQKTYTGSVDDDCGPNDSYEIYDVQNGEELDDGHLAESDLARAHWIQLHKTNKQGIVIQNTFLYMLQQYKHIRPFWHFGKKIVDTNEDWKAVLYDDFYFRHHCASIQAGITMIMENKDDSITMRKVLNEVGAHHFFYDAAEPHLEIFEEGLIESMKKVLHGVHALDANVERSWRALMEEIKTYVSEGIIIQRNMYMKQCMTPQEIDYIRNKWANVMEYGQLEAGRILCETALKSYDDLLARYHIQMPIPELTRAHENFDQFAEMTVLALDITVKSHREDTGFSQLTGQMKDYVTSCLILDVCPPLVRKAFMQGLISMLSKVLGDAEMSEVNVQTWSKIYRVLEQAVIANIVDY